MNELKPTNQKPVQSPVKKKPEKGEVRPLLDSLTKEQLDIYGKQKEKVGETKEERVIVPARDIEKEEGFEKINIEKTNKEDEGYDVKVIKVKEAPKGAQK